MTDRELKKLNRLELLELLLKAAKENENLRAQEEELAASAEALQSSLNEASQRSEDLQGQLALATRERTRTEQEMLTLSARLEDAESNAARLEDAEAELREVRAQLAEAEQQRVIIPDDMTDPGNIAEASLKLNGIFEAAQQAANEYLENIRALNERTESENQAAVEAARAEAARMVEETRQRCEAMLQEAEAQCNAQIAETEARCESMRQDAVQQSEAARETAARESEEYWQELSGKLLDFCRTHKEIRELLNIYQSKIES